jgi:hypothetical protein
MCSLRDGGALQLLAVTRHFYKRAPEGSIAKWYVTLLGTGFHVR